MTKKYKRKFLVPGDTPKSSFFVDYCQNCTEGKLPYPKRCRGIGSFISPYYGKRPLDECIHKDKLFNQYIVSEPEEGPWQCSCKGWIFKYKKLGQDCDHIKRVKKDPKKFTEIPVENTGTTIEALKRVFETSG